MHNPHLKEKAIPLNTTLLLITKFSSAQLLYGQPWTDTRAASHKAESGGSLKKSVPVPELLVQAGRGKRIKETQDQV